jgi:hypothetical protein
VSTAVGNVKNQDPWLVLPVELSSTVATPSPSKKKARGVTAASQNMMASWLNKKKEVPTSVPCSLYKTDAVFC